MISALLGAKAQVIAAFHRPSAHYPTCDTRLATLYSLCCVSEVNLCDDNGRSPLGLAVSRGHTEAAEMLLAAGADVNLEDEDGDTPLHAACEDGRVKAVDLLLGVQADVHAANLRGRTALYNACAHPHSAGDKLTALLITARADVTHPDGDGNTALHAACLRRGKRLKFTSGGHTASYLMQARACPDVLNNNSKSAYDVAQEGQRTELLLLLQSPPVWNRTVHSRVCTVHPDFCHRIMAWVVVAWGLGIITCEDVLEQVTFVSWQMKWNDIANEAPATSQKSIDDLIKERERRMPVQEDSD